MKFDINLLINQDSTKLDSKSNAIKSPIDKTSKEIPECFQSHHPKMSEDVCTKLQKPKKKTHRIIKSMKLEINMKIFEDKMVDLQNPNPMKRRFLRSSSTSYVDKSNKIIYKKKKNQQKNDLIAANYQSQTSPLNISITKLKEQNFLYSNLFDIRMRRNTIKIKENDNNEVYDKQMAVVDPIIEQSTAISEKKPMQFKTIREKYIVFDFQIMMMLIITIMFSVIRQEIKLSAKVVFFPFKMFCAINGLLSKMIHSVCATQKL